MNIYTKLRKGQLVWFKHPSYCCSHDYTNRFAHIHSIKRKNHMGYNWYHYRIRFINNHTVWYHNSACFIPIMFLDKIIINYDNVNIDRLI